MCPEKGPYGGKKAPCHVPFRQSDVASKDISKCRADAAQLPSQISLATDTFHFSSYSILHKNTKHPILLL